MFVCNGVGLCLSIDLERLDSKEGPESFEELVGLGELGHGVSRRFGSTWKG